MSLQELIGASLIMLGSTITGWAIGFWFGFRVGRLADKDGEE